MVEFCSPAQTVAQIAYSHMNSTDTKHFNYVCLFVCGYVYMSSGCKDQRYQIPLELELHAVVNHLTNLGLL